jgi:hypothetical protein
MARVRILLEDDNGQPLIARAEQLYPLEGSCNTLDAIETAVEEWRKKALPDIEKALLTRAQEDAIAKKNRP